MSSRYFPEVPVNYQSMSQEEMFQWLFREFERVAQTMADELEVRELLPQPQLPNKYQDGSIINLDTIGANQVGSSEPGLFIYRDGQWRRLMEV